MALTDEEFRAWCQRNKIEPETITSIQRIRSSEPERKVRGGASNVSGRYPSQKMGFSIASQPFFYALDQTAPRYGGCPFARAHLDHTELDIVLVSSPKCTFSGVVSIDLKRFLASGIRLVECPDCARMRTLSPRNGVLRFPVHSKRETRPPVTSQRWAMEKTIWEVVGGERT